MQLTVTLTQGDLECLSQVRLGCWVFGYWHIGIGYMGNGCLVIGCMGVGI